MVTTTKVTVSEGEDKNRPHYTIIEPHLNFVKIKKYVYILQILLPFSMIDSGSSGPSQLELSYSIRTMLRLNQLVSLLEESHLRINFTLLLPLIG